jgi:hypothetical protein
MIEQGRKRRVVRLLASGLAVAAVAGVAIAGTAVAHGWRPSSKTDVAGGPGTPTAVQTPEPVMPAVPTTQPTPTSPRHTTPTSPTSRPITTPTPALPRKPTPPQTQKPALPADAVAACKTWLNESRAAGEPGASAKVVARLKGAPGTVLILADSNYWVGCDTAYARNNGKGSIRQPAAITGPAPGDAEAFTVANNLIPIKGKQYEYFWAAGRVPAGVTRISYAFPDGLATNAVIQGKYWIMQHQVATPWQEGMAPTTQIKVTLYGANGQQLRDFQLNWGEDTCAQITHGC